MSVNSRRAAEAEAAAARSLEAAAAKSLAAKQLSNALNTVDPLASTSFHKFQHQIKQTAHSCEWHPSVLEGEPQEGEEGDIAPDTPKHDADVRNAYELIMKKTDGHPVESKLESVEIGNSAEAWETVLSHFVQTTARGHKAATTDFFNSTMENTDTDLLQWAALCRRNSQTYQLTGGRPTEADLVGVYLGGLLRDFEPIKDIIESRTGESSFASVCASVEDYARPKKLLTLKRSSGTAKNRTFVVNDSTILNPNRVVPAGIDPNEECRLWSQGRCRFGDRCYRIHRGPGGVQKRNRDGDKKSKATCSLCQSSKHVFRDCPQSVCLLCQSEGHVAADCTSKAPRQSGQASSKLRGKRLPTLQEPLIQTTWTSRQRILL